MKTFFFFILGYAAAVTAFIQALRGKPCLQYVCLAAVVLWAEAKARFHRRKK